jgi:hypothetical protein
VNVIVTATISATMPLKELWVIIAGSKKVFFCIASFYLFIVCPWPDPFFLKKDGSCLDTF